MMSSNLSKSGSITVYPTGGGFKTAATSKMEYFVTIVITKCSILYVPVVLDPPLLASK